MPAGRPTKYTPKLLERAREYLLVWEDQGDKIPSHIALSKYIGVSSTYMYDWAKEEGKEEFSEILREVKELQQQVLLNNGLDGTFNAAITKLVLGKHGFHEKVDQNQGGQPGNPIKQDWTVNIVHTNADTTDP